GASGNYGRLAIQNLLELGVAKEDIVAGARNVKKVSDLTSKGIKAVRFDYDDYESLINGLEGITHFIMVSVSQNDTPVNQHDLVIEAASKAKDLEMLAYTSVYHADISELPLAPIHRAAEEKIIEKRIPHIFLRDNAYMEMYLGYIFQGIRSGSIVSSAGDAKISGASRADLAKAAAIAILNPEYYGKTLELSGDTAFDFNDFARIAGQYRKADVQLQNITLEQSRQMMKHSGFGKRDLEVMTQLEKVTAEGKLYSEDHTLSEMLGRPTTTIEELMKQFVR
ncbi:MAG: NAD(P)H-binding protein, partial [Eubacteriales bacterium]|nr:NAD(P)H-binding protein [Eubacteriales bacterium]